MYWLWLLLLFAVPFLAVVPWDTVRGWLLSRRWQHDPHDPRPRMIVDDGEPYLRRGSEL
ncbi:hypothetical protein H0B56_12025 [Haloechinothrix sp. YIM 98757]|uniref:Uncharacterized protein n=1 Tax=Haloechinothrix aidingensis TaxID=2752311 RepID=A0A838AAK4_9PSEU|nr:hypothetical protein [Haloechinothrix aidingensis]MBA0126269.1 hypothetical protein [Haloechinothrix aidingensis]